jgi:hypothetical protein
LLETDPKAIVVSGSWFWKKNGIGLIADDATLEIDLKIKKVTKKSILVLISYRLEGNGLKKLFCW